MSPTQLQQLVTDAVALDREIRVKQDALKVLKAELIAEACARPDAERVATEGGGWSWTAPGADGCIARVTASGPKLRDTFDPTVPKTAKLLARFGSLHRVLKFFRKEVVFRPRAGFRDLVEQEFAPATADRLLAACASDTAPRVSFETKPGTED